LVLLALLFSRFDILKYILLRVFFLVQTALLGRTFQDGFWEEEEEVCTKSDFSTFDEPGGAFSVQV
jgi:hypothetical protein